MNILNVELHDHESHQWQFTLELWTKRSKLGQSSGKVQENAACIQYPKQTLSNTV